MRISPTAGNPDNHGYAIIMCEINYACFIMLRFTEPPSSRVASRHHISSCVTMRLSRGGFFNLLAPLVSPRAVVVDRIVVVESDQLLPADHRYRSTVVRRIYEPLTAGATTYVHSWSLVRRGDTSPSVSLICDRQADLALSAAVLVSDYYPST